MDEINMSNADSFIAESCRILRLPDVLKAYREHMKDPDRFELSFPNRLALILQQELDGRRERKARRLWKESRMGDAEPSIEGLIYGAGRNLDKAMISELSENRWITDDNPRNLIVTGKTGTGKTWLSKALGKEACRQGLSVLYIRMAQLIEELERARKEGTPAEYRHRLNNRRLLIIDDFGMSPMKAETLDDFLSLVDERKNRGSLIIASQRSFEHWYEYISPNGSYLGDALMDRLKNWSYFIELKGESLRK